MKPRCRRRVARDDRLLLRGSTSRRCIQRSFFILSSVVFCRRDCGTAVIGIESNAQTTSVDGQALRVIGIELPR
jgi:hypothetical protein